MKAAACFALLGLAAANAPADNQANSIGTIINWAQQHKAELTAGAKILATLFADDQANWFEDAASWAKSHEAEIEQGVDLASGFLKGFGEDDEASFFGDIASWIGKNKNKIEKGLAGNSGATLAVDNELWWFDDALSLINDVVDLTPKDTKSNEIVEVDSFWADLDQEAITSNDDPEVSEIHEANKWKDVEVDPVPEIVKSDEHGSDLIGEAIQWTKENEQMLLEIFRSNSVKKASDNGPEFLA